MQSSPVSCFFNACYHCKLFVSSLHFIVDNNYLLPPFPIHFQVLQINADDTGVIPLRQTDGQIDTFLSFVFLPTCCV